MIINHFIKNKEKRKRVAHVGAAVTILIHAYDNYETGHHSFKIFAIAGTVFLIIAFLHPVIEKKLPWVDGIFLIIEGILSMIVAYDLYSHGKKALPTTYLFLAIFQFYMAFKRGKKGITAHNSHNEHERAG